MMVRLLSLVTAMVLCLSGAANGGEIKTEKYDVIVPKADYVPYTGKYKAAFPDGFPIGIGSGMTYIGRDGDALLFYAIGDRGPNADAPKLTDGGKKHPTKMFPAPNFHPSFGVIRVKDGKAELVELTEIKDTTGKPISGRPIPRGQVGSTGETPLDDSLAILDVDPEGMDTEGVAIDRKDGNLWICDEYGPFIAKMDKRTGKIIKKYVPGKELPAIAAKRQPNRGFEGIAVTPSNKVIAAVQSICDVDGKVKKSEAVFTRLVVLDPATGKTQMLAYPIAKEDFKKSRDVKIGDLHAIDDDKLLIVEQGKGKKGKLNRVYIIDMSGANDISGIKAKDGKELETLDSVAAVEACGVKFVKKALVAELRPLGWKPGKAEGLALLEDGRTLAVCSDNDFGFKSKTVNPATGKDGKAVKKATKYTVDAKQKVSYDGKPVNTEFELVPTGEECAFWLVTLPKKAVDYLK